VLSHQPLICCPTLTSVLVFEIAIFLTTPTESQITAQATGLERDQRSLDPVTRLLRKIAQALKAAPAALRTMPPMRIVSGCSALELGFNLVPQYQAFVHFAISAARLFLPSRLLICHRRNLLIGGQCLS
jgi:hypothetical protein